MTWWSYGKGVHRRDAMRALGAAGAGSFAPAGGQVSQRPDQGSNPPQSAVAPSQAAGTLRARVVIISGTNSGVFEYNGTPGAGTLAASFSEASVDPFGNKIVPGSVTFYNNGIGQAVALQASGLGAFTGSFAAGWSFANANVNLGPDSIELGAGTGTAGYTILGPSGDTTGATDSTAFGTLATGETLLLTPGTYYINAPITLPSQACLIGVSGTGNPSANFGGGGLPMAATVLKAVSGFTGASMIEMASAGSQTGGQRIEGIALDGSGGPGSINAIQALGWVAQVKLRDVAVYGGTSHKFTYGLLLNANSDGNPDAWDVDACAFQFCNTACVGILTGVADSFWRNVSCTAGATDAWKIINGGSSRFLFCKGETSAGYGFNIQGVTGFSGFLEFTNCSGEINTTGDFSLSGAGTGTYYFNFCHGLSGTPWTYAGSNNVKTPAAYNTSTAAPTFN